MKSPEKQSVLFYSPGASHNHANLFPAQASNEAQTMPVISGRRCYELYGKRSPLTSLVRTLLASSTWQSSIVNLKWIVKPIYSEMSQSSQSREDEESLTELSANLKKSAIKSKHLLFQLAPLVRRTEGTGCGLLLTALTISDNPAAHGKTNGEWQTKINKMLARTPSAGDAIRGVHPCPDKKAGEHSLVTQIAMLPTPRAEKHSPQSREDFTPNLAARIEMLPTPRQFMWKDAKEDRGKCNLGEVIGPNRGLKLQPAFVEWMMGYPDKWTELTD